MADQILTQEEIDALLSAMDKGDVDLQAEKKKQTENGKMVQSSPRNQTRRHGHIRSSRADEEISSWNRGERLKTHPPCGPDE